MNCYAAATMENIHRFLLSKNCPAARKEAGTSEGWVYQLPECFVNIRVDKDIEYLIFEAYPGITMLSPYFPLVAHYCQSCHLALGSWQASLDHGDVYFHMETAMVESAVTEDTLQVMETVALQAIQRDATALEALAHGIIPDIDQNLPCDSLPDFMTLERKHLIDSSTEAIDDYLKRRSRYNIVARNIDAEDALEWVCEVLIQKERWRLEIHMDMGLCFLTMKAYPGLNGMVVHPPYRWATASYCTKQNDGKKICFISVGDDEKGCHGYLNTSLLDGIVTGKTIGDMDQILLAFVHSHRQDLELIGHGMFPMKIGGEQVSHSRLNQMKEMLEALSLSGDESGDDVDNQMQFRGFEGFADLDDEEFS